MARKNRRSRQPSRALPRDAAVFLGQVIVDGPSWDFGRPYVLRRVGSAGAVKFYVCPGCNNSIPPGVSHVVAWPEEGCGVEERRHWHTLCWERR
ncbi:MAG: hypothetical protein SOW59_06300 [Corynebacterium sp.]|nr:hypothetical protein [Corynebacterium sp.]